MNKATRFVILGFLLFGIFISVIGFYGIYRETHEEYDVELEATVSDIRTIYPRHKNYNRELRERHSRYRYTFDYSYNGRRYSTEYLVDFHDKNTFEKGETCTIFISSKHPHSLKVPGYESKVPIAFIILPIVGIFMAVMMVMVYIIVSIKCKRIEQMNNQYYGGQTWQR